MLLGLLIEIACTFADAMNSMKPNPLATMASQISASHEEAVKQSRRRKLDSVSMTNEWKRIFSFD